MVRLRQLVQVAHHIGGDHAGYHDVLQPAPTGVLDRLANELEAAMHLLSGRLALRHCACDSHAVGHAARRAQFGEAEFAPEM